MLREEIISKAKKLKVLSDRGIDGERQGAILALERFCKKYNIKKEELEAREELKEFSFRFAYSELRFVRQVIASVLGSGFELFYNRKSRKFIVKCGESEFCEIKDKLLHYWKLYNDELEYFWLAFVQANKLYTKQKDNEKSKSKMSDEEIERILGMSDMIKKETYRKKISNKN